MGVRAGAQRDTALTAELRSGTTTVFAEDQACRMAREPAWFPRSDMHDPSDEKKAAPTKKKRRRTPFVLVLAGASVIAGTAYGCGGENPNPLPRDAGTATTDGGASDGG